MARSKSRVSKVRKSSRGRRSMRRSMNRSERRSKLGRKMRSGAKTRRKSRTGGKGKSKILIGGADVTETPAHRHAAACLAKGRQACWMPGNGCHWVRLPGQEGLIVTTERGTCVPDRIPEHYNR